MEIAKKRGSESYTSVHRGRRLSYRHILKRVHFTAGRTLCFKRTLTARSGSRYSEEHLWQSQFARTAAVVIS